MVNRCTGRWQLRLRHAVLPHILQKRGISAVEMYLTICIELADDHFGLDLT